MAKVVELDTSTHNKISAGTNITGDINTNGDIRLDGTLQGNLSTKGKLVIGESGKVIGVINCKNADIEGKIEGKIVVAELLSLKATSNLNGDITTNRLSIEPGSKFTGNCDMSGSATQTEQKYHQDKPKDK
ncbi:MAG: polymer-forming cytoskeletal protein [Bacteroidales bacterium]|nr:polymer-forming cytoskeletal protein [Bacteroidales bacterium]